MTNHRLKNVGKIIKTLKKIKTWGKIKKTSKNVE
jgi:hypothetical protein